METHCIVEPEENETALLGEYIVIWNQFEMVLSKAVESLKIDSGRRPLLPLQMVDALVKDGFMTQIEANEINELRTIRNEVVHGAKNYKDALKPEMVKRLLVLTNEFQIRLASRRNDTR